MTRRDVDEAERTAAVVERLAALLAGGASAVSAWQHVANFASVEALHRDGRRTHTAFMLRLESRLRRDAPWVMRRRVGDSEPVEMIVARELRAGQRVGVTLGARAEPSWRSLGCAWALAERTGAPLARGLSDLAQTFRDFGAAERDVELALAGPSSAARLVMGLPGVGVLLGLALGFDSIGVLFGTLIGGICLAGGLVLTLAAHLWNRALIAAASRRDQLPGLALDLTALGMLGGAAPIAVLVQVVRELEDAGLSPVNRSVDARASTGSRVERVLSLAREAGVPAAALLRSEAALDRREARADASRKAAELGVRLMLPLGLCVLPAFLLLGVAPLILAVVTQTLSQL